MSIKDILDKAKAEAGKELPLLEAWAKEQEAAHQKTFFASAGFIAGVIVTYIFTKVI